MTDITPEAKQLRPGVFSSPLIRPPEQKPMRSLLASAARVTSEQIKSTGFRKSTHEAWQDEAWAMFDLVGEQRFLTTTLAQRASQAHFFIGKIDPEAEPGSDPVAVSDQKIKGILDAIGDGQVGFSRLIERMFMNLFITGDGWLVGIPKDKMPGVPSSGAGVDDEKASKPLTPQPKIIDRSLPTSDPSINPDALNSRETTLDALEWRMLSVSEVAFQNTTSDGSVKLTLGPTEDEQLSIQADQIYLIRVWRSHPRYWWQADSPTRASLSVLRELVGLTMHISAQVDSRLAGAGVFIVPASASEAVKRSMGMQPDDPRDPFTEAMMDAMLTPIADRSNASAVVPLVLVVPDDVADKFTHITFAKPLDTEARALREEAIRRLALGEDAPPELLLGTADTNHWGAWLVAEEVVEAHIAPPLALISDALTTQYLRPIMEANGVSDFEQYVVWFSVEHMIIRASKGQDAQSLYDKGVISDETLREANGFDETDAPSSKLDDPIIKQAMLMVQENPGLMRRPGLDVIYDQLVALANGKPLKAIDNAAPNVADQEVAGDNPAVDAGKAPTPATPFTPGVGSKPAADTPAAPGVPSTSPGPSGAAPSAMPPGMAIDPQRAAANQMNPLLLSNPTIPAAHDFGIHGSLSDELANVFARDVTEIEAGEELVGI